MNQLKAPTELRLSGNVQDNWNKFKQRFELYLTATGMSDKPEQRKVALFLTIAGPEALEVYNTFTFTEDERNKLQPILDKFEAHCSPPTNETYERYLFRCRMQQEGETIEQFITDLKTKAQLCNFKDLQDSLIRDQIVMGVRDKKITERLLREPELSLKRAAEICQAAEAANVQLQTLTGQTSADVHTVKKKDFRGQKTGKPVKESTKKK